MTGPESSSAAGDGSRPEVDVSISIRTLLVVAAAVAVAWALASIGDVLLLIFVSLFSAAVLSPVVDAMEGRLGWSRGLCATLLVLGVVIVLGAVLLVLVQAMSGAIRDLSDALPQIVEKARHSDLGNLINGSDWLDTLKEHASDITGGVGKVSGGITDVGASAFGTVTLFSPSFS